MRCLRHEEALALYAGGELGAGKAATLEVHLRACPSCRKLLQEIRRDLALLREVGGEDPPESALEDLRRGVLAAVARESAGEVLHLPALSSRPAWKWALAASLLLALALVLALVLRGPHPQAPAVDIAGTAAPRVAPPVQAPVATAPTPVAGDRGMAPALETASKTIPRPRAPHPPAAVPDSSEGVLGLLSQKRAQEPLVLRLQTGDGALVIYWLVENPGG